MNEDANLTPRTKIEPKVIGENGSKALGAQAYRFFSCQKYNSATAKTIEEARKLIEQGWE